MIDLVAHALCSVADVKLTMAADIGTQRDDLIRLLINGFSDAAEGYIDHSLLYGTYTEYFECGAANGPGGPRRTVQLSAFPVDADPTLLSLYEDPTSAFDASTKLVEGVDFVVDRSVGMITHMGAIGYEAGALVSDVARPYFLPGAQSLKCVYSAGAVKARPDGPATPTTATIASGVLTGSYRTVVTTVVDATGVESAPSIASDPLVLAAENIRVTFANPGSGSTSRIYRTIADGSDYYYAGSLAGSGAGGNQTFDSVVADVGLDTARQPPAPGPLVIKADLRLAAVMQVNTWERNSKMWSVQRISQNDAGSAAFFDPTNFLPFVRETLEAYRL